MVVGYYLLSAQENEWKCIKKKHQFGTFYLLYVYKRKCVCVFVRILGLISAVTVQSLSQQTLQFTSISHLAGKFKCA